MMTTLSTKNKIEFILGTYPWPGANHSGANHSTFPAWNRCNNMVVSWLVHFISVNVFIIEKIEHFGT